MFIMKTNEYETIFRDWKNAYETNTIAHKKTQLVALSKKIKLKM